MDKISITIPSNPQFVEMVRLSTASIASKMEFNLEVLEDLKVSVSEVINHLLPINENLEINYYLYDKRLEIEVRAENIEDKNNEKDKEAIKLKTQILMCLMDDIIVKDKSVKIVKNI